MITLLGKYAQPTCIFNNTLVGNPLSLRERARVRGQKGAIYELNYTKTTCDIKRICRSSAWFNNNNSIYKFY